MPSRRARAANVAGARAAAGGAVNAVAAAGAAVGGAQTPSAGASFKELVDRVCFSEDVNQRLRQQLSEAQMELEENSWRLKQHNHSAEDQESQLHQYREMI